MRCMKLSLGSSFGERIGDKNRNNHLILHEWETATMEKLNILIAFLLLFSVTAFCEDGHEDLNPDRIKEILSQRSVIEEMKEASSLLKSASEIVDLTPSLKATIIERFKREKTIRDYIYACDIKRIKEIKQIRSKCSGSFSSSYIGRFDKSCWRLSNRKCHSRIGGALPTLLQYGGRSKRR